MIGSWRVVPESVQFQFYSEPVARCSTVRVDVTFETGDTSIPWKDRRKHMAVARRVYMDDPLHPLQFATMLREFADAIFRWDSESYTITKSASGEPETQDEILESIAEGLQPR